MPHARKDAHGNAADRHHRVRDNHQPASTLSDPRMRQTWRASGDHRLTITGQPSGAWVAFPRLRWTRRSSRPDQLRCRVQVAAVPQSPIQVIEPDAPRPNPEMGDSATGLVGSGISSLSPRCKQATLRRRAARLQTRRVPRGNSERDVGLRQAKDFAAAGDISITIPAAARSSRTWTPPPILAAASAFGACSSVGRL